MGPDELSRTFKTLAEARRWFAGSGFNLAVDYWTFLPWRPYGSGVTRKNLLPVLKKLKPGFLQIYAKGQTGHTSFRSSLQTEHPMLAKDLPRFYREVTRETGTKLFLYWSGLQDGLAAQRHPQWRLLDAQGQPFHAYVNQLPEGTWITALCPHSPYFDEWLAIQLREVFATADPDGIWVDCTWMPPCHCARCVGRFREESGFRGDIPEGKEWKRYPEASQERLSSGDIPGANEWQRYWAKVMSEFRDRVLRFVRSLKSTCLCSFGNVTVRSEFLEDRDWCSGDHYSPKNHRIRQSIMMRRYNTVALPADAWICDTAQIHAKVHLRPRTKSLDRMLQEGAGILANGGLWTYWTFPMAHGGLVPSRMRIAEKAAAFARARRDICLGTESVRWTAILDMEPKNLMLGENVWGAGKALIHLHRSPDSLDESCLSENPPYDLIVVPEQPVVPDETVAKLEAFVRSGGKLLSTGQSITSQALQNLLGVKLVERAAVDEGHVFLKNGNPAGVFAAWDRLELAGARELYPLFLSCDSAEMRKRGTPANVAIAGCVDEENPEPAGFPAATLRRLGKGLAVHVPTSLFDVYWRFGYLDVLAWLREIFDRLQPEPLFRTDAYSWVEVALRRKGDALHVHFVNGNPGRDLSHVNTSDLWVDEIPPVGPIRSWIRCPRKPKRVAWHPGAKPAEYRWREGMLEVVLPKLAIHACLVVEPWLPARGTRRAVSFR